MGERPRDLMAALEQSLQPAKKARLAAGERPQTAPVVLHMRRRWSAAWWSLRTRRSRRRAAKAWTLTPLPTIHLPGARFTVEVGA